MCSCVPSPSRPSLTVVVPAHNAEATLPRVLQALIDAGFGPDDILVVNDGSTDRTGEIARAAGLHVLCNDTAVGPAEARNRGAQIATGDFVVFVDADVAVHPDVRTRILEVLASDPGLDAVFGSYDADPPAGLVVSRYRNLLHHYVHQSSGENAATFWTGLGAVRRDRFVRLGGLDRAWQDIEDVEFGVRLRRSSGRIRLDRDILGKHLKAWTLRSMVRTDLWGRAIPWSRLILFAGGPADDLNLGTSHRLSAVFAAVLVAALVASLADSRALWLVAAALIGFLLANVRFLLFLTRQCGLAFAIAALPYHVLHYGVAIVGYAWVRLVEARRRESM